MLPEFISITNLQRNLKKIFISKQPIHIVLSKNTVNGMVFSKGATELLLESGALDQIREELWELHDKDTIQVVRQSRKGKGKHSQPFDMWLKSV